MKTKCLLLFCGLFLTFFNLSANNGKDGAKWIWPTIECKFEYYAGSPDSRGVCVGQGTCRVFIDCNVAWLPAGTTINNVSITRNDAGQLIIDILKNSLTKQHSTELFGHPSGKFSLASNAMVSAAIKFELSLPPSFEIKAGEYDFTETSTYYRVVF